MSERQVWAVTKGSYSDYRVMCVCPTKKAAQRIADAYNDDDEGYRWSDAGVEEFPAFDALPEKVRIYERMVHVWDDGSTSDLRELVKIEWPFDLLFPHYLRPVGWRWVRAPMHAGKGGRLEVYGTDEKRVAKVFSEKRAQLLADDAFRLRKEVRS